MRQFLGRGFLVLLLTAGVGCSSPKPERPRVSRTKPADVSDLPALVLNQPPPPNLRPQGSLLSLPSDRIPPPLFREANAIRVLAGSGVSTAGLSGVRFSGSGQFDRNQLYWLQSQLHGKDVLVLDVRGEPHGMVNNAALTWANDPQSIKAKSSRAVQRLEARRLQELEKIRRAPVKLFASSGFAEPDLWQSIDIVLDVRTTATPSWSAREARFDYRRIVFSDGELPDASTVRQLVKFFDHIPPDTWVHVYCDTGGYRTSLVLTMADMALNAPRASCETIIERQAKLGGADLTKTPEILEFLEKFYQQCLRKAPILAGP